MQISWVQRCFVMTAIGCAVHKADPSRVIASTAPAPTTVAVAEAERTDFPWSHRRSIWPGPAVYQEPEIAWTVHLPGPVVMPLTSDGQRIFAVASGNVYAIGLNGEKAWTARVKADGLPVPSEEGIAVALATGRIVLLDPFTGRIAAELGKGARSHAAPLMFQDAWIWVTVGGVLMSSDGDRIRLTNAPVTDIAADQDRVYVGTGDGDALAVDRSGIIWEMVLPGPVVGHPVVGDSSVFFAYGASADQGGGVAALGRADGVEVWRSDLGFRPSAAPALGEFLVVPGRASELVALDPIHGGTRWRCPGYGDFTVTPALVDHAVYAGNADGRMHRVDMHDGGQAWSVDLGATITGDPLVIDGTLVVGLTDGRVVGLR